MKGDFSQDWEKYVQEYDKYTREDHAVWEALYQRQVDLLEGRADPLFLESLPAISFRPDAIPEFDEVNEKLRPKTGWEIKAVPGLIPDRDFFTMLLNKKFPVSTWIRSMEQLDYLQEPDMFHDVFGHVPLLTVQAYCDFLSGLADIALDYIDNKDALTVLARLYWYTIEFGLIRKEGVGLRIYGAGIFSSKTEVPYSLEADVPRYDFDVKKIMQTPKKIDDLQYHYFVIRSYTQLYESLKETPDCIDECLVEGVEADITQTQNL